VLDYSNQASTDWSQFFVDGDSSSGNLVIPIWWGSHEQIQGVRDFTKNSRLRLEKLLTLAHQKKRSLNIQLGFSSDERSFPTWTRERLPGSPVPVIHGSEPIEALETTRAPSFLQPAVKDGFLQFLEEVLGILSLYCSPQGPVNSIRFSWGPLELDSHLAETEHLSVYFRQRYGVIGNLNSLYQTCFKDFDTTCSKMGIRTLFDKRPWVAAWDFKNGRSFFLKNVESEIFSRVEQRGLTSVFTMSAGQKVNMKQPQVVFDDMLLESLGEQPVLIPLRIFDQVIPTAIPDFRFTELIKLEALQAQEKIQAMSQWNFSTDTRNVIIFAQRFMRADHATGIKSLLEQGTGLFFPLGLPQWDENLNLISWSSPLQKAKCAIGTEEVWKIRTGAGTLVYPTQTWEKNLGIVLRSLTVLNGMRGEKK